jgi:phosphoglycolate phosphatase
MFDVIPGIKAVLFDLDGTLLYTIEDIRDSMNAVLERMDLPTYPTDRYYYFVGRGVRDLVIDVLPHHLQSEKSIAAGVEGFRAEYAQRWFQHSVPYPGIPETLDRLFAKPNLKIGILSNKPQDFAEEMVARLLPRWTFHGIVGASPKHPIKPDPTGGLQLIESWGIESKRTVMVGDSDIDIKTARNMGAHGVGVSWGFRPISELITTGAELILDEPKEILRKRIDSRR